MLSIFCFSVELAIALYGTVFCFDVFHEINKTLKMKFCLEYATENRHYAHTDCPGHADFIKNMITGAILRIKTLSYLVTQMLIFNATFLKFIISQIDIEMCTFYIQ
jgi:hypothetical protein